MRFLSAVIQVFLIAAVVSAQSTTAPVTTGANVTSPASSTSGPATAAPVAPSPAVAAVSVGTAPIAMRVAFANSQVAASTPAIAVNGYVVYGAGNAIVFAPTNCVLTGGPQVNSNCQQTTVTTTYPVTSVAAVNATTFVAVYNTTVALYNGVTLYGTITTAEASFDISSNSYSGFHDYPAPTFDGSAAMYIGSRNFTTTAASLLYKIGLNTFTIAWATATPYYNSNYQTVLGYVNGGQVIGYRATSGSSSQTIGAKWTSNGQDLPSTLSISSSYSSLAFVILNNQVYAISGGYFYSKDISTAGTTSSSSSFPQTDTRVQMLALNGTRLVVTSGSAAYLMDLTSSSLSPLYSVSTGYSIHRVVSVNNNAGFIAGGSQGLSICTWSSGSNCQLWFTVPSNNFDTQGCEGLWWQNNTLIATFSGYGITASTDGSTVNGGTFGFNGTSGQQLWRFSDNYDALGPAVAVPSVVANAGLSYFGTCRNVAGPYGVRSLIGWSSFAQGTLSNIVNDDSETGMFYDALTNLVYFYGSGTFSGYTLNGTLNFTTSSFSSSKQLGVVTFPTAACVGSTGGYSACYNFVTKAMTGSMSNPGSLHAMTSSGGFLYLWGSSGVYKVDPTTASLTYTTLPQKSSGVPLVGFVTKDIVPVTVMPYTNGVDIQIGTGTTVTSVGASSTIYTSNAINVNGNAYVAGLSLSTGFLEATGNCIARIELPIGIQTRYTVKGLGNVNYLTTAPGTNTIFAFGDNISAWSTTGANYYTINPPAGQKFYSFVWSSSTAPYWYNYKPSVDPVSGTIAVALSNASSSLLMNYAIYNMYTGALYQILALPQTFLPPRQAPALVNGYWTKSSTHACLYRITNDTAGGNDARVCFTTNGLTGMYGMVVNNGTIYFAQNGQMGSTPMLNITGLQMTTPFVLPGSFSPTAWSILAEIKANLLVIIIAVVAVLLVIVVVAIIVKVKSGSKPADNAPYVSMNQQGV